MVIRPPNVTGIVTGVVLALIVSGGAAVGAKLITGNDIKNGTITTKDIKNGTVSSDDLKNNNVKSGDIKDGTVATKDLAKGAVTAKSPPLGVGYREQARAGCGGLPQRHVGPHDPEPERCGAEWGSDRPNWSATG